jgi:hypothetical protein
VSIEAGDVQYLLWSLNERVSSEDELFVYKRTTAVLKLEALQDSIIGEVNRLKNAGTLNEDGALRQKSAFIAELLPKVANLPRLARRMALLHPAILATITILYAAWYLVTA